VKHYNVIIVGGGAAGLMCAIEAGKRGRSVLLLERQNRIGKKIRISGGGRCNFTNIGTQPENFISTNPGFVRSALARFTPEDFIELMERHSISYHEKKAGQLFCNGSAQQIIDMLWKECTTVGVALEMDCTIVSISKGGSFLLGTSCGVFSSDTLVIATGGKSLPKIGATPFGYEVAEMFDIPLLLTRPGLVPLTFDGKERNMFSVLSGVSLDVEVRCGSEVFCDAILCTHRGLSGPAILQTSIYWQCDQEIVIDLLPGIDIESILLKSKTSNLALSVVLSRFLPKRFTEQWLQHFDSNVTVQCMSQKEIKRISEALHNWRLQPSGTEGYSTAEVTCGGVDTRALSSKTMETKSIPGLFFIGEIVDVTGWLGGYNLQWAWSSGWVAGQVA